MEGTEADTTRALMSTNLHKVQELLTVVTQPDAFLKHVSQYSRQLVLTGNQFHVSGSSLQPLTMVLTLIQINIMAIPLQQHSHLSKYQSYYTPVLIHKMLLHAAEVIQELCRPLGQSSEERMEGKNKDLREVRQHYTCKTPRIRINKDLIPWLLILSDPKMQVTRKLNIQTEDRCTRMLLNLYRSHA